MAHRRFILVLALKLYFLWDHVLHNHPNQLELIILLVWLYMGIGHRRYNETLLELIKERKLTNSEELYAKYLQLRYSSVGILEKSLIVTLCLFVGGPSYMIHIVINAYVVFKFIDGTLLNRLGRDKI